MFKHIEKNIIYFIVVLTILAGCQRNPLIHTHGISYLEKREKLIFVNKSNKNDVVKILGNPATKGMIDDNLWIYIERTKTRASIFKLGKSITKKNNVLVLEFNNYGILNSKDFFDKSKMKDIKFAKAITENEIKKERFIYSFLSSIRQKMQTRKK
jgi:outer membrane protein assembly factor BamE (lipoprotein component of BamABCDE complex)